jgi:hypothetical protein
MWKRAPAIITTTKPRRRAVVHRQHRHPRRRAMHHRCLCPPRPSRSRPGMASMMLSNLRVLSSLAIQLQRNRLDGRAHCQALGSLDNLALGAGSNPSSFAQALGGEQEEGRHGIHLTPRRIHRRLLSSADDLPPPPCRLPNTPHSSHPADTPVVHLHPAPFCH